jgi:hypothetical protein
MMRFIQIAQALLRLHFGDKTIRKTASTEVGFCAYVSTLPVDPGRKI